MSKHTVGSTWKAANSQRDKSCYIWFSGRKKDGEIWIWKIVDEDESILSAGIGSSYKSCLKKANFNLQSEKKAVFEKIR